MSSSNSTHADQGNNSILGSLLSGKTPAVANIESAYSRAGAYNNHTPGVASKLGSQDQKGAGEHQGIGSAKFSEKISDQRQEPSVIGKVFNSIMNGTDKTK